MRLQRQAAQHAGQSDSAALIQDAVEIDREILIGGIADGTYCNAWDVLRSGFRHG